MVNLYFIMSCKIKCGNCNCGKHASRQNCRNKNEQRLGNKSKISMNTSTVVCRSQLHQCRSALSNAKNIGTVVSTLNSTLDKAFSMQLNCRGGSTHEKCEFKWRHVECDY